jgi:hypothetical protein
VDSALAGSSVPLTPDGGPSLVVPTAAGSQVPDVAVFGASAVSSLSSLAAAQPRHPVT